MLGAGEEHRVVPYFFSDLADWASLEYVGGGAEWDQEEVRGSPEEGSFSVWYRDGGRVRAVLDVNGHGDIDAGREAILKP
jgi:3-phenylpropionate/trans-cinnamate dioxygenase ferredoxin reductase subunit